MTQLFFDCSNASRIIFDRSGHHVRDLGEMRDHAARLMRKLIDSPNDEDWRAWVMHVSDPEGEEVMEFPFSSLLGPAH